MFQAVLLVLGLQILVKFGLYMVGILLSRVGSLAVHGRQGDSRVTLSKKHKQIKDKRRQEAGFKLASIPNSVLRMEVEKEGLYSQGILEFCKVSSGHISCLSPTKTFGILQ